MNDTAKKVLNIISKVIGWILIAFTVFMMVFTIVTVSTVNKNDRGIFGWKFYIVKTDSMSLSENNKDMDVHFNAGDIIISKEVADPTKLEAGMIISFLSTNSDSMGETITHMIREVRRTDDGRLIGYVTFGTNTGTDDEAVVEPGAVIGVYSGKLPGLGHFFAFLKTTPGYITCILVPFLLLILWQGVNTVRIFKRYRREQMADMIAEREQIAKEREESAKMMRELMELKKQLAQQAENNGQQAETKNEVQTNSSTDTTSN